jgi:glycosyltransferase involved in cell wall biosynthesis
LRSIIAIPAYNPDIHLLRLVNDMRTMFDPVLVVVNDGSASASDEIFDKLRRSERCTVLDHEENMGKGAAIKTAASYILKKHPDSGFVMTDADYQHMPADIQSVSNSLEENPQSLILGVRDFSQSNVPFKSRWGNRITSVAFKLKTGVSCKDTQTGLRGIPSGFIKDCLSLPGNRFEYEICMLIKAAKTLDIIQIPIKTVYEDNNRASNFNAVTDSYKIYKCMIAQKF